MTGPIPMISGAASPSAAPAAGASVASSALPTTHSAPPSTATPPAAPIFDSDFEMKLVALCTSDERFVKQSMQYLKPEYFTNAVYRNIFSLIRTFVATYHSTPDPMAFAAALKAHKKIAESDHAVHIKNYVELTEVEIKSREYIISKVNEFCQRQEYLLLAADIPKLISDGSFDKIEAIVRKASSIGKETVAQFNDYFERVEERRELREQMAAGKVVLGVSTGFPEIDDQMYRKGFVRGGLTAIMAPSKRGKTAFMGQSALYTSALMGNNALYISLEVGQDIFEDRLDAALTKTAMSDLVHHREDVAKATVASAPRGKLYTEYRPSATFTTDQVHALVESYFVSGRPIDIVYVDYIGILKMLDPKDRFNSLGVASKHLRAIAGEFNIAMITGAQTNREAVNKQVSGMDSIGESFSIVQDVDLLISLNANEQEMAQDVRRIHWAASRNEAERTITVHGNMEQMRMIEKVLNTS